MIMSILIRLLILTSISTPTHSRQAGTDPTLGVLRYLVVCDAGAFTANI